MARFNCLATFLAGKKKRSKDSPKSVDITKTIDHTKPFVEDARKENHFNASIMLGTKQNSFTFSVKMVGNDDLVRAEVAPEAAYEAGDEHEEVLSMKRDFSDLDLQARAADNMLIAHELVVSNQEVNPETDNQPERDEQVTREADIQNIHLSDPEMGRATAFWGSPVLKRSCSNIETKRAGRGFMSRMKSHSYNDLQNLSRKAEEGPLSGLHGSPRSVMTNCSADRVMLKKRSSSQVLPSRSRKLWWKLFLWSHRNLHKPRSMKPQNRVSVLSAMNQKGGYSSDTLEPSSSNYKKNKKAMEDQESGSRTDLWPQSQWVAFSAESESSPLDRVNAWVNSLDVRNDGNDDGEEREAIVFPSSPEIGESSGKNHSASLRVEEAIQANNIIQSLNSFSSVAHIFGMGLKVIPAISAFSSLRAVNLSNNFITHITPGSLPKSLHTLDLSRNKIGAIEGLRELTRLRVLNLSYNRISSIGHGLSNCTIIKELYLAGNKISDVEGLHRLLKLAVLDLSFNKITTAKSLGQLVANYNSLLAINLLGNPIQSNIGDDQLRKAVTGLLPQLTYLNKQSIRPQRAREAATDSVAKAALGNAGWSSRRRMTRRESPGGSGKGRDGSVHRGSGSGSGTGHKSNRHRTKSSK